MSSIQNRTIVEPTKTVVCSPAVLAAVTDVSLIRICQSPLMTVQSSSQEVVDCSGLTLDAAQIELCRRYRPLILKYARLSSHQTVADDVESFLWIVFLEAVQSYDTSGDIPFAGYVKSMMHYGHLRFFKQTTR
ncbi:MAG: sigma-70 family RNA polymerase sigma factor, partial [Veillonella caviae]|nr:sigma-70 family RNA polymerase sigma factor [Veillonella caviae]